MAEVNYPFKTLAGYNAGAATWASGLILEPGAGDGVQAELIRKAIERLSELTYYIGSGGVSDVYIVGNGTPPAGGYTPLTNPIKIKGTGLHMDSPTLVEGSLTRSGSGATYVDRHSDIGDATVLITLDDTADVWYVDNPTWVVNVDYVLLNAVPENTTLKVVAWGLTAGGTIRIRRSAPPAGIIILNIGGTGMGWGTFRKVGSSWRLMDFGGDATITTGTP